MTTHGVYLALLNVWRMAERMEASKPQEQPEKNAEKTDNKVQKVIHCIAH